MSAGMSFSESTTLGAPPVLFPAEIEPDSTQSGSRPRKGGLLLSPRLARHAPSSVAGAEPDCSALEDERIPATSATSDTVCPQPQIEGCGHDLDQPRQQGLNRGCARQRHLLLKFGDNRGRVPAAVHLPNELFGGGLRRCGSRHGAVAAAACPHQLRERVSSDRAASALTVPYLNYLAC